MQATVGSLVEALDEVAAKVNHSAGGGLPASDPPPTDRALMSGLAGEARTLHSARHPSATRSLWRKHWARGPVWERFEDRPALQPGAAESGESGQPARHFLRRASHIQAAAWIAARLAEGLEHAHSRGLIHRDMKPSNVLIADDGTPMLLDFNLATDTGNDAEGARAMFGGTLPYMAPEHLDAFNPHGKTSPETVDERSDIYALGLILFEMVAGRPGFPDPPTGMPTLEALTLLTEGRLRGAPSLREANPTAPWSLDAILRKCLDPEPSKRYQRAAGSRGRPPPVPRRHAPEICPRPEPPRAPGEVGEEEPARHQLLDDRLAGGGPDPGVRRGGAGPSPGTWRRPRPACDWPPSRSPSGVASSS